MYLSIEYEKWVTRVSTSNFMYKRGDNMGANRNATKYCCMVSQLIGTGQNIPAGFLNCVTTVMTDDNRFLHYLSIIYV